MYKYFKFINQYSTDLFQEQQSLRADVHVVHGEVWGVHLPESERGRHPGPCHLLPRGPQEKVEVCHRSSGLQAARLDLVRYFNSNFIMYLEVM